MTRGRFGGAGAAAALLGAISIGYLLQLATPLRMNTDAIAYFLMAMSARDGHGFLLHHHKAHYPSGYPAVLAALDAAGWGNSFAFVAWNYLMLAISMVAAIWLLRRWLGLSRQVSLLLAAAALLSVGWIRLAPVPGSEPTYTALSMLCLVCLTAAETAPAEAGAVPWAWLVVGAVLTVAMVVRSIGVVLWPAVIWSLLAMLWKRRAHPLPLPVWIRRHQRALAVSAVAALVAGGAAAWGVGRTAYVHEAIALTGQSGPARAIIFAIHQRCIEAGSVLFNLWTHSNPRVWKELTILGVPSLLLVGLVLLRRLRRPMGVDIYLLAYFAVLMVWPYKADNRFWFPVVPLVLGVFARELCDLASTPARNRAAMTVACAWSLWFAGSGTIRLYRSTRLTYAGSQFSERYDLEWARDTYRLASGNGLPVDQTKVVQDMLTVLRRYGSPQFTGPHPDGSKPGE